MKNRHLQDIQKDPMDKMIPALWISNFEKQISEQSRNISVDSSPNLKRSAEELSSPNSPQQLIISKKTGTRRV